MKFSKILFSRYAAAAIVLCTAIAASSCMADMESDASSGLLNVSGTVYDYNTEAPIVNISVTLGIYDEDDRNNRRPLMTTETVSGQDGSFSLSIEMMSGCRYRLNAIDTDGDNNGRYMPTGLDDGFLIIDFSGQGYDSTTGIYTLTGYPLYMKSVSDAE